LKVGTGQEVLRLPKPPDPIPQQPPTLPSDHQADEESDADHRTKASSDGNDSDIDDDDFNSIFRGNDSPTAEVAPGEDGDGTFGDDSSVDGGQAGETGEIDGGNIDRQEDEKSDMGHGIEASSGGNSPDVDDDNDSILSEDLGIDGDQAGEIEEEEVPASIPKLPLSPGDIESVMTEVDNILNEPSVSNISAEKKKSIRANCQWLADHNAQPEFIKNVALYRASIAAGNMGVEEDIKSTADMAVESTADMTDLSQRYHNYSEEDAAEKLCSDQYSELKRRINSQPIAVPNLSNISPALTIPAPEELQLVQEHWVRGNMALVTAVRDTVNQSVLQSPVKNSNSPISETVSLAKDTGVFNTYGIDTSTREKNNELYGELTSKVAKDLTFFYAQQQEIFDNNNFLGKIPGSPPTVMAVRKVTPEALLEMISVNGNTSTFEAKKAHGAESWSLIIPVDDDFATDVKVGGSAMITADIPVYEIGMSCVGMKIIQEKDQMELVRYPFSDLSVNVYNKVGKGIHHMGQKRGVTTNAEYRGYQDSVLDKLKENNQI
jgi:hypothetical protein